MGKGFWVVFSCFGFKPTEGEVGKGKVVLRGLVIVFLLFNSSLFMMLGCLFLRVSAFEGRVVFILSSF